MRVWKVGLLLFVCLSLLVGCGGSAARLIETPVQDINLTAEEIGEGFSLVQEEGADQFTSGMDATEAEQFRDGSLRLYMTEDFSIAMSGVAAMKTVAAAKSEMRGMISGFQESFSAEVGEVTFEEVDAPSIGEEAVMLKGVEGTSGLVMYLLAFREVNVIGISFSMGMDDAATMTIVNDIATKIEAKIQ